MRPSRIFITTGTSTVDNLLSDGDVVCSVEINSPALGQIHGLTVSGVECAVEISTPNLTDVSGVDALTSAGDVICTVEISAPALGQVHVLTSSDIDCAVEISAPALADVGANTDPLLSDGDVECTVDISTPALGQIHSLTASNIDCSIEISYPALGTGTISATVTISCGESKTGLSYLVLDSYNIATASIAAQGTGESTDASGELSIDLAGSGLSASDPVTIIVTDYTTSPSASSGSAVCYTTVQ